MLTEAEELELLELEEAEAMAQGVPEMGAPEPESPGFVKSLFPSASRAVAEHDGGMISDAKTALGVAGDVLSIPQRAAAAMFSDQKFSDPNAYLGRESVENAGREGEARRQNFREIPGENPQETLRRMQRENVSGMSAESTAPVREFATRALTDPLTYAGGVGAVSKGAVKVGKGLQDAGKNVLRRAVKPSRPSMRAWNPPDFEVPLREKLVTKFGGLEKAGQNIQSAVEQAAEVKDAHLASSKIRLTGSGAINQARKNVIAKVGRGDGLSAIEVKKIPEYMDEAFETAKSYPSFRGQKNGWSISGQDAVEFRKWMDRQTTFDKAKDAPPRAEFYRNLRRAFEDQIDTRVGQTPSAKGYQTAKKQLADLMPVKKAFEERLLQDPNNYAIGLRETALLGGAIASGNAGAAAAKAGIGVAINRLLNRPGGAAILYELGTSMAEPGPMKTLLLTAAANGKISGAANRILDALAITKDEERKAMLEDRLMKELGSSFEAKK